MFNRNYPVHSDDDGLLSIVERTDASTDFTGRRVVIAFVDSGFYPHPEIQDRILVYVDATTRSIREGALVASTDPLNWHGQMTSVIAAGDGRMSAGRYRGLACDAHLVLIKVSNRRGAIKEADILRGMRWLAKHGPRYAVRIVNISVGGDYPSDDRDHPIYKAIRRLTAEGMTVLAAGGNSGSALMVPPASAEEAITVGGVDDQNTHDRSLWRPYHNSYGTAYDGCRKPDILAPGAWIASPILPGSSVALEARWLAQLAQLAPRDTRTLRRLVRDGHTDLSLSTEQLRSSADHLKHILQARIHAHKIVDSYHQHVEGTSVAVAIASSLVAQMIEANPRLTPLDIKDILLRTAERLPNAPAEIQGEGIMNARAAVDAARSAL